MFKDIKGIIYNGGDPGRAFGGGIYGASCNVGFSSSPTKITLSVVSEDGVYTDLIDGDGKDIALNVTSSGAKTIEVGDIKFHNMYLYSYTYNDTPSSKTLTVNFVDQSLCLDKIFVGLTMRHGTSTAKDDVFYGPYEGPSYNPTSTIDATAFSQTYEFRLMCLECNSLRPRKYVRPAPKEPPASITRLSYMAGDGTPCPIPLNTMIKVNPGQPCIDGGYMLLGKEGYTETPCEIPKVEYSFDDLCNALDYILGGDPNNCNGKGVKHKHNLREFKRSSTYTASYTGNLREVLSAWAADFSFDFSFDYTKADPYLEGISLSEPIDLEPVKKAIENGFGEDSEGGLIRNMSETHSLENTYRQNALVKYMKPVRPFVRQQKHYAQAVGKVLTLKDAVGSRANLGRTFDELYVSIALSKFQPEVRLTWLSDVARRKWLEVGWENPVPYPSPCKECPDWAAQRDANGQQKYKSEYGCIVDGAGNGRIIPNNASQPQEVWYNYGTGPGTPVFPAGKPLWGKTFGNGAIIDESRNPHRTYNRPDKCIHPPTLSDGAGGSVPNPRAGQPLTDDNLPEYYCEEVPLVGGVNDTPFEYGGTIILVVNKSKRPGWQNPAWRIDVPWMALGFFPERRIASATKKQDLLDLHKEALTGRTKKPFSHPVWKNPANYECFIGIWNENWQQKVEEYDKDVADNFFGKYGWWYGNRTKDEELSAGIPPNFGPVNPPASVQQCPKWAADYEDGAKHRTYMYKYSVKTLPESKVYSGNSYPFIEVLKVNDYVFGDSEGRRPLLDDSDPCTYCPQRSIFEIEDNTWGTSQEVIDELFTNRYVVDSSFALPFTEDIVPMSDINQYVPIYSILRQDRLVNARLKDIGISYFEETIYRPEHAQSGYFPGIAFIPNMDIADSTFDLPILKVDYSHWQCSSVVTTTAAPASGTTTTAAAGAGTTTTAAPASDFCATGCPPCTCGDPLDAVAGTTCGPPDCIYPCWDCMGAQGKSYGTLRSIGAPAGTPAPPADNPNYEPSNPAWDECLNIACQEDYGYCWRTGRTIGYPTERVNDAGDTLPALNPTTCVDEGGTWKGDPDPYECYANQAIDVKVAVNPDPKACACWECVEDGNPKGEYHFGNEEKALEYCKSMFPTSNVTVKSALTSVGCAGKMGPEGPCPEGVYLEATEVTNYLVYENTRRRKNEWAADNAPPQDCTLWCEEDVVKKVCGCDPPLEPVHHFSNYRARYVNITHLNSTQKIIFPIEHDYVGFWHSNAMEKGYYPKKQIVLGTPPDLANNPDDANVMETRIVDVDATQDLDSVEKGDSGDRGAYQEQLVVQNPYNLDENGQPIPEVVSLPTYYTFIRGITKDEGDQPGTTINVKSDGTEFDTLKQVLSPAHGLSNFTVTVGSDGISTDVTYLSKPAKLPKRDVLMQKIGPRATEGRIPKPSIDTILNDWNV